MKITQFEQSGLLVETNSGYKLAIDIGIYTPISKLDGITPDAMLVSHIHRDHFALEQIKRLSPKKLYLNEECIQTLDNERLTSQIIKVKTGDFVDIDGIKVTFFEVDHGPNVTIRPKENFGFLIQADEERLYFAGDMFYPSGMDVRPLEVDYAYIPVGGFYTFDPKEAIAFAKQFLKIGRVIPMHYEKDHQFREEFLKMAMTEGFNTDSFLL